MAFLETLLSSVFGKILAKLRVYSPERSKLHKSASTAVKKVAKTKPTVTQNVEDQLTEHLKQAEHHLIAALELFSRKSKPVRRVEYYKRLLTAQETITGLYREELVRIRGPLARRGKK